MTAAAKDLPLEKLKLPEGFHIEIFVSGIENARQMALSPSGVLYVGSRDAGNVYAVKDKKVSVIAKGLKMPSGVVFHKGDLYVAATNQILVAKDIEKNLKNPKWTVVRQDFPSDRHHGWKYLGVGPDEKLYVPVGAPCNVCLKEDPIYASITRMNLDGSDREIIAHGVRNSVGFDWNPQIKNFCFTDNGRDLLGDNVPSDELNCLDKKGEHFGFPYCHEGRVQDPKFKDKSCKEFKPPIQRLGPHVAGLGMKFYRGKMFPAAYRGQVFIAEHGSWNRSKKIGYRITMVTMNDGKATNYTPFVSGWLDDQEQSVWGRPSDILEMPDGSLLVADDYADVIYRITYSLRDATKP